MRPVGSAVELERRRAVRLLQSGHARSAVARMVGAAVSAVWQWRETWRRSGAPGLAAKPAPGRPPRLTPRQRRRLPQADRRGHRTRVQGRLPPGAGEPHPGATGLELSEARTPGAGAQCGG